MRTTAPDHPRYTALAETLLATADPVAAIAHLLGDHEARLDGAFERITHLESKVDALRQGRTA